MAGILILALGFVPAALAAKKEKVILRVASFEPVVPPSTMWRTEATKQLDVDGLGTIKLDTDRKTERPYVEIWPGAAEAGNRHDPVRVRLPRSRERSGWKATALGLHVLDDGTVLIAGNEFKRDASGTSSEIIPSLWTWRPGSAITEWKHWIVDRRLVAKGTKPKVSVVHYVAGFDPATGNLSCVVTRGHKHGMAELVVEFVVP